MKTVKPLLKSKYSRIFIFSSFLVCILSIIIIVGVLTVLTRKRMIDKYPRHYIGSDITYFDHNEDHKNKFYSKFGSIEFQCFGKCYCHSSEESAEESEDFESFESDRRSITRTLTKTLSYFVVSVTSFVAYDSAKRYFEERCETTMMDDGCDYFSIQSEVETCEQVEGESTTSSNEEDQVILPHRDTFLYDEEGNVKEGLEDRYLYGRKYICKGRCKKNILQKEVNQIAADFGCETYWGEEREIRIFNPQEKYPKAETYFIKKAANLYRTNYLMEYCNGLRRLFVYEIYETYKDEYPDIAGSYYEKNKKDIIDKAERTTSYERTLKMFCSPASITKTNYNDDRYQCRYTGSFTIGNAAHDPLLQDYDYPGDYATQDTNGDYFPHDLDKNEDMHYLSKNEVEEVEDWGFTVRQYEDTDKVFYSDPPPHYHIGEDYFEVLVEKECEEEGDREKLEKLYELYMRWYRKNKERLPVENRLGYLGKYHVLANLLEWMKRGGDPKIFLEVEKKRD